MVKSLSLYGLVSILLMACAQSPTSNVEPTEDYMIFGSYSGECIGTCARFLKIQGDDVFVSSDDDESFWFENRIEFKKKPRTESNNEHIKAVADRFPQELLLEPSREFGEPDSWDQGGIYIEVMIEGDRKVWKIDTAPHEDIPAYLNDYLDFIASKPL